MTLYIRRIFSPSLQGGFDHELGPKTLLVGDNGKGKSRVRRGIELVLKGVASDVAGRDEVAKNIELLSLATPGQDLSVRAFISDGTEAAYLLKRKETGKGKSAKVSSSVTEPTRQPSVDPATVLPLWALREGILGAPGTARRFFLSHAVREVQRSDILSRLPGSLGELYVKAVESSGIQAGQPEINKLLAAAEIAQKRAGEGTRESNAARKAVTEAGSGLAPPPTEAELAEAAAAIAAAKAALEGAVAGYQSQSRRDDLASRLEALRVKQATAAERMHAAQEHLTYIEAEVAKLPGVEAARAAVPALSPLLRSTIDAVLAHAVAPTPGPDGSVVCGVCGAFCEPERFTERSKLAQAELDKHVAATKTANGYLAWVIAAHIKADEYLTGARFEVGQAAALVETIGSSVFQLEAAFAAAPEAEPTLTIENARLALTAAEERQRGFDQAKAAWESTRRLRDGAVQAEAEGNKWAQLFDACNDVIRELLDNGVAAFCARVQAYLPPTDKFSLRLRDGGREVCQFGLQRGEALYTALSGAEWARVTAALAAVCGPNAADKLAVVCPEERAFHPRTLSEVMKALGAIPQQVVLESPVWPVSVPEGWTVVDVEAARPAAVAVAVAPKAPAPPPPAPVKPEPPKPPPPPPFAR